ncbi:hypothetical protein ACOSQ2_007918 [Xanthoceras sorbifolium]
MLPIISGTMIMLRRCGVEVESLEHALWWCVKAKNVWAVSGLWDRLRRFKGLRCCEVLRGLFPIVSVKDLEQGRKPFMIGSTQEKLHLGGKAEFSESLPLFQQLNKSQKGSDQPGA